MTPTDAQARAVVEKFCSYRSPSMPKFKREALQEIVTDALREAEQRGMERAAKIATHSCGCRQDIQAAIRQQAGREEQG